jgi:hypothetical protein
MFSNEEDDTASTVALHSPTHSAKTSTTTDSFGYNKPWVDSKLKATFQNVSPVLGHSVATDFNERRGNLIDLYSQWESRIKSKEARLLEESVHVTENEQRLRELESTLTTRENVVQGVV